MNMLHALTILSISDTIFVGICKGYKKSICMRLICTLGFCILIPVVIKYKLEPKIKIQYAFNLLMFHPIALPAYKLSPHHSNKNLILQE